MEEFLIEVILYPQFIKNYFFFELRLVTDDIKVSIGYILVNALSGDYVLIRSLNMDEFWSDSITTSIIDKAKELYATES